MDSRRTFLKVAVGALGAAAAMPLTAHARPRGANSRIRLGIVGCGSRAERVFDAFARQTDVEWVAGCEVNPAKLQAFMTPARRDFGLRMVTDYRRILDRHDIDAVLISTPDFSHARVMIDAIAAAKDVYVETPASNSVARVKTMYDAYKGAGRVVQVGTQQRSCDHFVEAKTVLDSSVLGNVRHVVIVQPGTDGSLRREPQMAPHGLDWNTWQLLKLPLGAPERPFTPDRLAFRSWYEYGSGGVGHWGAHHVDTAHWFMNADRQIPHKTSAVGIFGHTLHPDPEQVPDTFSISWEYDSFVMTFASGDIPRPDAGIGGWGTFFIGTNGSLQVNRLGYAVRPPVPRTMPGPASSRRAARARVSMAPLTMKVHLNPRARVDRDYPLEAHVRNFLDCVKSRETPNSDMEIGYYSALPCLLALESMRASTTLGWDPTARHARAL